MQAQPIRARLVGLKASALWTPAFLFALNLWMAWRLFRSEFIDQLPSIEGVFMALARYIQNHGAGYNWFPLWWTGMPFQRTYQPGLPGVVAVVSTWGNLSIPAAYHATVAVSYALGAATFYFLALTLTGNRKAAFVAGLAFTFFSPSTFLIAAIRQDAGGLFAMRRYQVLVQYGEGPNITGHMLVLLAMALLHRALTRRTAFSGLLAALAMAAVPAVSWPSTLLLAMAVGAYVLAMSWAELKAGAVQLVSIMAGSAALALPFALPSTVWTTFYGANHNVGELATAGAAGIVCFALLGVGLIGLRIGMGRLGWSFARRFAVLFVFVTGWTVLTAFWAGVRILPQAERYHIAMEMALWLAAAVFVPEMALWKKRPQMARWALVALVVACGVQAWHGRRYAREMARPLKMNATLEYETGRFFELGLNQGRVFTAGTQSFWMNLFAERPQFAGCCDQSVTNRGDFVARWVVAKGYQTDEESADYSLLWLKAYAVKAIAMGGPKSRGHYKDFDFPYRFRGRLQAIYEDGDDFIYQVPERAPGLARVVRPGDLVKHPPENGIDVKELRAFVAALDDERLPIANFRWSDTNTAEVSAVMERGQAVEVAVTWDPGWSATVEGRPVAVRQDGLGFLALEPECAGTCNIEMTWSAGWEPRVAIGLAVLALMTGLGLVAQERHKSILPLENELQGDLHKSGVTGG